MNTSLASSKKDLAVRAQLLAKTRAFFAERGVMEVDTDILSPFAPVDAHIDVMEVDMGPNKTGYLHTSPEYAMKKLLAQGSGDIYQLSHVFRRGEISPIHTPEFTMLEWYRNHHSFDSMIDETLSLIHLFLGDLDAEILTYREALLKHTDVDYVTEKHLEEKIAATGIDLTGGWDRDGLLTLLFSDFVEPHLGNGKLTVVTDYPATQAALAKREKRTGYHVARRFEIYFNGIELANGYDELSDPKELQPRLEAENKKRIAMGKRSLPLDHEFIALQFPACCGVAVGFDRLAALSQ